MEDYQNKLITPLLIGTSHKLRTVFEKILHKNQIGINFEQFILLKYLLHNNGVNQKELALLLDRDKTTIARLISKLETNSHLLRVPSKKDKRINHIYITNSGKEKISQILPFFKELEQYIISNISAQEKEQVIQILNIFRKQLNLFEEKLSIQLTIKNH